jgi:hypothetical protein
MLVLHIGLPKTGTSTLQHWLAANAKALERIGAVYPAAGRGSHPSHLPLAKELVAADGGEVPASWRALADMARIERDRGRTVVVSSEVIGHDCKAPTVRRLLHALDGIPLTVVVYVREFAAHVVSVYTQKTKKGVNILGFDDFFEELVSGGRTVSFDRLMPWGEILGWERVRVRSLDPRSLAGGNLIEDFMTVLGPPPDRIREAVTMPKAAVNAAPDWRLVEIARAINTLYVAEAGGAAPTRKTHGAIGSPVFRACEDAATALGWAQRGSYLTYAQRRICHDLYAAEVGRLNAVLVGTKLPEPIPPVAAERPFLPDVRRIETEALTAFAEAYRRPARRRGLDPSMVHRALRGLLPESAAAARHRGWVGRFLGTGRS